MSQRDQQLGPGEIERTRVDGLAAFWKTLDVFTSLHRTICVLLALLWLVPSTASLALALHTAFDHGEHGHHEGLHQHEGSWHAHDEHAHHHALGEHVVEDGAEGIVRWARLVSHGHRAGDVVSSEHQHSAPLSEPSVLSRSGPSPVAALAQSSCEQVSRNRGSLAELAPPRALFLALFTRNCALLL